MPQLRPRRWFQFRLSTWFVLVAILAWAMLQRPVTRAMMTSQPFAGGDGEVFIGLAYSGEANFHGVQVTIAPKVLLYPAVALLAFIGWKTVWAIGKRAVGPNEAQ